eukprot:TRINITY_DN1315_c0_g1_i7.p1 TRINITY_DN1315_c0_g1~~TRINITY_DN1315_c0_g1_i7.p1  ORF type:complete len:254 (-),score=-26.59 TRINITY_DN1315_c0_g1_i7:362-1123(-)
MTQDQDRHRKTREDETKSLSPRLRHHHGFKLAKIHGTVKVRIRAADHLPALLNTRRFSEISENPVQLIRRNGAVLVEVVEIESSFHILRRVTTVCTRSYAAGRLQEFLEVDESVAVGVRFLHQLVESRIGGFLMESGHNLSHFVARNLAVLVRIEFAENLLEFFPRGGRRRRHGSGCCLRRILRNLALSRLRGKDLAGKQKSLLRFFYYRSSIFNISVICRLSRSQEAMHCVCVCDCLMYKCLCLTWRLLSLK